MTKFLFMCSFFIVNILSYNSASFLNQKSPGVLKTGWYYIEDKKNDFARPLDKSDEKYYINPEPIVTAKHFSKVEVQDVKYNGIANQFILIQFDSFGTDAWSIATSKAMNKKLALIIDDKLIYTPEVNTQITSGVSALNRGIYSKAELQAFANTIKTEM